MAESCARPTGALQEFAVQRAMRLIKSTKTPVAIELLTLNHKSFRVNAVGSFL